MGVAEELDLDVPGAVDPPLEVDAAIAEPLSASCEAAVSAARQILRAIDHAHAPPPSPGGRLDEQGEADGPCFVEQAA